MAKEKIMNEAAENADLAAEIMEAARAEAERIVSEAKAEAEKLKCRPKTRSRQGEEEVSYTFFKDNGEYSDDVFISVNCEKIVCQRGVPVKIKRKFVWAYEQAMKQQKMAAERFRD